MIFVFFQNNKQPYIIQVAPVERFPSKQVNVDGMQYEEEDGGTFSHECRCGEAYVVTRAELLEGFEILDCTGCSLYIRVVGTPTDTSAATDPTAGR